MSRAKKILEEIGGKGQLAWRIRVTKNLKSIFGLDINKVKGSNIKPWDEFLNKLYDLSQKQTKPDSYYCDLIANAILDKTLPYPREK